MFLEKLKMPLPTLEERLRVQKVLANLKNQRERQSRATEMALKEYKETGRMSVTWYLKKYGTFSKATWKGKLWGFQSITKQQVTPVDKNRKRKFETESQGLNE